MMQQCYCSQGGSVAGQCSTCGAYRGQSTAFSNMFFDPSSSFDHQYQYQYASSSSVDCTLSLGTPSTRMSSDHHRRPSYSSCGWEHNNSSSAPRRGASNTSSNDPLLARRCANCDTTSTPLWRNGPRGPKSLCNACGIRYKKEERRASAAASSGGGATEHEQHVYNNSSSWGHQSQKMPCYSAAGTEYRFMDDVDNRDSFLSWRLNVTDRPAGLVHDFTR